ncbi:2-succinyl-6-hydroxy-2,4-cyclohexadiene-1-carboxylate synthase [Okeania sp. SIO2B3]|uniref:2-succinyl-6-hydroxy-2, 4-cyclohexadiene-1-carboxylate synthase n=1 Tax=Okeania sp. SIO2B3 TaxID=2607784 RepID=UPI0013BF986A|nr:2-succinyl-6-hydroxy-2,4-cyclohexadiene-1-carboxylate synthase [Okeania sp. SIO2B3]NET42229.1 2-succinyl-6-hydroxy-2,4-cyclohexadiene-1-carboxylate synthase [Okeania sp. SIO2B3]
MAEISRYYQLNYYLTGKTNKPVILLLHGFMGSSNDFVDFIPQLCKYFCCLTVDLPGHGKTIVTGSDGYYDMENTAIGLIHLLDELKIDNCYLFGYSMGGRLALYMAINFPTRFNRVILESASPGLKTEVERSLRCQSDLRLADKLENSNFQEFLSNWYSQALFKSLRQNNSFEKVIERRLENKPLELAKSLLNLGTGNQPSLWDKLSNHQIPTLLMVGEFDDKFQAINLKIVELCQVVHLKIIPESGHNIHWENPQKWIESLINFLVEGSKK